MIISPLHFLYFNPSRLFNRSLHLPLVRSSYMDRISISYLHFQATLHITSDCPLFLLLSISFCLEALLDTLLFFLCLMETFLFPVDLSLLSFWQCSHLAVTNLLIDNVYNMDYYYFPFRVSFLF